MRYLTKEQRKEYPITSLLIRQCQLYCMREYGGCQGCDQMVDGCEKVIVAGLIKEREGVETGKV